MITISGKTQAFVISAWYRDCDPIFAVVGFDKRAVQAQFDTLVEDQRKRDEQETEDGVFTAAELMTGGVHIMLIETLALDDDALAELGKEGIAVF